MLYIATFSSHPPEELIYVQNDAVIDVADSWSKMIE